MSHLKLAMTTGDIDRNKRAEGFIADWVEALATRVDELVIIIPNPQGTKLKAKNVRVYSLAGKDGKFAKLASLYSILRSEHTKRPFDGIFNHIYDFMAASGAAFGRLYKINSIMWFCGGLQLHRFSTLELAFRLNNQLVTCSESTKQKYLDTYHLGKPIHVLGHAINTNHFKHKKRSKLRKTINIISAGRFSPGKNYHIIIQALSQLQTNRPIKLQLLVSNPNVHKDYLRQIKTSLKKLNTRPNVRAELVINTPYANINRYLSKADLYIHASDMYSVDKAGLEAIASGIPVLLSRHGYTSITSDPHTLINPQNTSQLVSKLDYAISHYPKFSQSQRKLQKTITDQYSLDNFMTKLVKLYAH